MLTDTSMRVGSDAAQPYRQGLYRHYVLLLLVLMYALTTVDRGIIMALIEPIKREPGLSDTYVAILVGMLVGVGSDLLTPRFGPAVCDPARGVPLRVGCPALRAGAIAPGRRSAHRDRYPLSTG